MTAPIAYILYRHTSITGYQCNALAKYTQPIVHQRKVAVQYTRTDVQQNNGVMHTGMMCPRNLPAECIIGLLQYCTVPLQCCAHQSE